MVNPLRVLIIDDCDRNAESIAAELGRVGRELEWERVDAPAALTASLDREKWDLIISDYTMPQFRGTDALRICRRKGIDTPFIFLSGTLGEEQAVQAIKEGAQDYILKDRMTRLVPAVERELREAEMRRRRDEVEEALRVSEERFRQVLDHTPAIIFFKDIAGRYLHVNPHFERCTGFRRDMIIGRTDEEVFPAEQAAVFKANDRLTIQAGVPMDFEETAQFEDGPHTCLVSKFPVKDGRGGITGLCGIALDITGRKRAEEELKTLNRRLRLIAGNTGAVLSTVPVAEQAGEMADQVRETFGVDVCVVRRIEGEELVAFASAGESLDKLIPRLSVNQGLAHAIISCQRPVAVADVSSDPMTEALHRSGAGAFDFFSYAGAPMMAGGRVIGILGIFEKKTQRAFTADELEHLQIVANQMAIAIENDRLYRELRAQKDQLAAHVQERRRAESTLARTEEMYRRAISAAGAVPYLYSYATGTYSFIGEGIKQLTGYAPEEFNRGFWERHTKKLILRGDAAGLTLEEASRRAKGGQIRLWQCDILFQQRDGSQRWLSDTSIQQQDEAGNTVGSIGILQDITERVRAEQTLRDTEEMYRRAIVAADAVVYRRDDRTGTFEFISEEIKRLTGYPASEMTPDLWRSLITDTVLRGECAGFSREEAVRRAKAGKIRYWKADNKIQARDGTFHWVANGSIQLVDDKGVPTGSVGILQDITDRKLAEEKIREQAALLDKAQDAICVTDMEQRVVYWNKSAEQLYGWSAVEVTGKNAIEFLFAGEPARAGEVLKTLIRKHEWNGEIQTKNKAGTKIIVDSRWTVVRDDEGAPRSILVINTDHTGRKQLEAQFLRAQRMESIGTLASGVAHDLNNVLAPVLMSVSLLRYDLSQEDLKRTLDVIESSAQRGADIVKQLLTYGRGLVGERVQVKPRHLLKEILNITRQTFPKNISIQFDIKDEPWAVSGDPTQLHQVLLNLCLNARDAMPQGGKLTLTTENMTIDAHFAGLHPQARPGPHVLISVADTGCGIPPEIVHQIFDPFFTTKDQGRGSGLGLSTAVGILHSHGGFINVRSEVAKGSVFEIYIPAQPDAVAEEPARPREALPRGQNEMILVVDDEDNMRRAAGRTLENHGYRVVVARDGIEAVAAFAANQGTVKMVLTDIMMPLMDGVALVRALKKMDPRLQVIAASGMGSVKEQKAKMTELKELGVDTFLSKPFTAEVLLRATHDRLKDSAESGAALRRRSAPVRA